MNESDDREMQEAAWRRRLTPEEEARVRAGLTGQPEKQADWEAETGLTHLLGQLPDVPVASNFTAQVLQQLDREERETELGQRPTRVLAWFFRLAGRPAWALATAAVVFLVSWMGYLQYERQSRQVATRNLVVLLNQVPATPAVLEDFDAIRSLPRADDDELYAVLAVQP